MNRTFAALIVALVFSGCSARNDGLYQSLVEQNGQKRLLQKIAITTSAAVSTLATTTLDDSAQTVDYSKGPTLMLQSDQDFWYEIRRTGATTAVTNYAGARPGVFVSAKLQEFVVAGSDAVKIDLKADTTSGTVGVFLVN